MSGKWFIKIWADSDYFDFWHINHFLAGMLCGGVIIFLRLDFWVGLSLSTLAMLGWEVYEIFKGIQETSFNKFADVILGIVGYFLFYLIKPTSETYSHMFVSALLVSWAALELWGFLAWKNGASGL
ncbi:MAG: hypothetical protein HYW65_03600 [Candidatus Liptonbacteria bacterium]|nr:hypothetical protein [Candidatus Liptonbacteria bacterium]